MNLNRIYVVTAYAIMVYVSIIIKVIITQNTMYYYSLKVIDYRLKKINVFK